MIQAFSGADGEEKKKELGFAFDVENQNQNTCLKVLRKAEYLQKKEELRQIKVELKSLKMTEATKDMMKDEGEDSQPSFDSAQDSFVKLIFKQDQFKTTGKLKDFILRISGVAP